MRIARPCAKCSQTRALHELRLRVTRGHIPVHRTYEGHAATTYTDIFSYDGNFAMHGFACIAHRDGVECDDDTLHIYQKHFYNICQTGRTDLLRHVVTCRRVRIRGAVSYALQ
jgi:hypothetical protein